LVIDGAQILSLCPYGVRQAAAEGSGSYHRAFLDRAKRAGVPVTPVHLTRKACASLLVALDVHPRVAMQILRHSKIAVTMEVYAEVVSSSTKDALRRLGEQLDSEVQA
jgi:integrase